MKTPVPSAACAVILWLPGLMAQTAPEVQQQIVSLEGKNINAQANLGVLLFFQNRVEAIPRLCAANSKVGVWAECPDYDYKTSYFVFLLGSPLAGGA